MKSEQKKLQGTWYIASLEMEGRRYPTGGSKIEIKGDKFTSLSMGAEYEGTITVDSAQNPKTFDLLFEKGPEAGNKSLGIYELDGDTWKICLGLAGKSRPRKFATVPGTGHALEILKRDREEPGAARLAVPDDRAEPEAELEGEWRMVSCKQDGRPMDPGFVKSAARTFRGNTTALIIAGRIFTQSRFIADRTKEPKTIDYPDMKQQGIYLVSGDTLRTSLVASGETRPHDFTANPGDGRTVSEWTRNKH